MSAEAIIQKIKDLLGKRTNEAKVNVTLDTLRITMIIEADGRELIQLMNKWLISK